MSTGERSNATSGGVADKWGNRYEAWWTVWRGLLPVLREEFDAIQVEPPDLAGEAAEFRLYGRHPDGPDEVHQCKRRHATSWTVPALDREGVLRPFGDHLAAGTLAVFASGTSSVLLTMAEKVRRLGFADWLADLNTKEDRAKDELVRRWDVTAEEAYDRLTRLTVHVIEDETLRVTVVEYLAARLDGDPTEALLRLADFVIDSLMVRLTSRQLWDFLRSNGFSPREGQDLALSERVRALNERYVAGVERAKPANLPFLARPEVDQVVQGITEPAGPHVVVVTGPPGSGKSMVLASACKRLAAMEFVVGPLRLDAAADAWTAEELGAQAGTGFGGPPARIVTRAAGGEQAVLVIDQLDALSVLTGRGDTVLDGVQDMLAQARATGNLRLLIACRSHDLTHDRRLRQLIVDERPERAGSEPEDLLTVSVGDLDSEHVRHALGVLGALPANMSPRLQQLLAKAFNLSLVANIVRDPQGVSDHEFDLGSMRSRLDLLAEYDRRLGRRLRPTLGADGYVAAVSRIARFLSDSGRLSLPRSAVADIPDTIDALLHEGVLVADQSQLRFFHDEYFDFIFAHQHVLADGTAESLVRGDAQDLLRRGQVRAVLSLERQEQASTYASDLRRMLDPQVARSHIRAAVLTWLSDQPSPGDHELATVLAVAGNTQDPLHWQAMRALCSPSFIGAIHGGGQLVLAADTLSGARRQDGDGPAGTVGRLVEQSAAYLLAQAARYEPEAAAVALMPLASDPDTATPLLGLLLQAVFLAGPTAGPATVRLFCTAVEAVVGRAVGVQDGNPGGLGSEDAGVNSTSINNAIDALHGEHGLGILALSTLAKRSSAPAVEAIHAWLAAAARLAAARGAAHVFDSKSPLPHRKTGLGLFEEVATRQPVTFARTLTPFLVTQLRHAASDKARWRPVGQPQAARDGLRYDSILGFGSFGYGLDDEIFLALRTALRRSAAEDPDAAIPVIAQLTATDLLSAHQLAADAFSSCATSLLPTALAWASEPRIRGLHSGSTTAWAWGEVLAHIAHTGNDEQRSAVVHLVIDPYRALDPSSLAFDDARPQSPSGGRPAEAEQDMRLAVEQLVVLSLIARRLGADTPLAIRERLTRLEEVFGPAPTSPTPEMFARTPRSPIPDGEARRYTDAEWVAAIHRYGDDPDDHPSTPSAGGAYEVAAQLEEAVKAEPARFGRLVAHIGPDANPIYVTTLIRAVTSVAQDVADGEVADLLDMTRTVSSWSRPQLNQPLCALVAALANRTLPDDIIDVIATIATTAADPANDVTRAADDSEDILVLPGLNSDRGRAINALAHLLAPPNTRHDRVQRLLPTLRAAVQDPVEQVHIMLPPVIFRTCLSHLDSGADLADEWLARATDGALRAPELDRLTWQLLLGRPALGFAMIQRMIHSTNAQAQTRGGRLAALADLRQIGPPDPNGETSATTLLRQALAGAASRKGVASLLAELVDELPEPPSNDGAPADPNRADRRLLVELLDDPDNEVRESAIGFALHLTTPLDANAKLLSATATSRAFTDHPAAVLHALRRAGGALPVDASLALCEHWLSSHAPSVGDIRTAAAGDAYHVVDIVLATHARTAIRSPERERCLTLLDRLIESGAADADRKADDPTSYLED